MEIPKMKLYDITVKLNWRETYWSIVINERIAFKIKLGIEVTNSQFSGIGVIWEGDLTELTKDEFEAMSTYWKAHRGFVFTYFRRPRSVEKVTIGAADKLTGNEINALIKSGFLNNEEIAHLENMRNYLYGAVKA